MPAKKILTGLRKLVVATLSGLFLTGLALAVFWLVAGDWVARQLSGYANQRFFSDIDTRLVVGRVSGSVFSDMVFEEIRIERQVGGVWSSGIAADRIEARYDLVGLLRGRPELSQVRVYGALIEISEDATGRLVMPVGTRPGEGGGRLKSLTLTEVLVDDARFRYNGRLQAFEANHLSASASLALTGDVVDLALDRASFEMLEPVGRIERVSGRLHIDGRVLEGKELELLWEGAELAGTFRWDPADTLEGLTVSARARNLTLPRVRGFIDSDLVPTEGFLSGRLDLHGAPKRFVFDADLSGAYARHPVDTLSVAGRRHGSVLDVERLRLKMPEYDITAASGTFDLAGGGRIDAGLAFNAVQVDSIPIRSVRWIKGRGRGQIEINLADFLAGATEPMTLDLRVDLAGDSAFGLRLAGVAGRVRFRKGEDVVLSDVVLTLPDGGTITGNGFVHPGDLFDIDLAAATGDWSQLRPIIAIPGLRGAGRATGRLVGTSREPALEIAGRFTGVTAWAMEADTLDLASLTGPFLPEPLFDGSLTARGLTALGRKIETVDLDFQWAEPRLALNRLVAVSFDTTLTATGWTDFDPPREAMTVQLTGPSLAIGRMTWIPDEDLRIDGRGARYDLHPALYRSEAGSARIGASFDTEAATMDIRAEAMDLDLLAFAGPDKAPEFGGGRLLGDLRLAGPNARPDPSGVIRFRDYRWGDAVIDSAMIDFTARGASLRITDGWADAGPGRLGCAGDLVLPDHAWTLWNRWIGRAPIPWEETALSGLALTGRDVDLARWGALNPQLAGLAGVVTGDARFDGTLSRPTLEGDLVIRGLVQGSYRIDRLAVSGAYAGNRVRVDPLRLEHEGHSATVRGALPVSLSLVPYAFRILDDDPMDLAIDLSEADLTLLPAARFGLEEASGDIEGTVRLRGTPHHPEASGELRLSEGRLRLLGREEVVEDLAARLVFDGDKARLESLTGRQEPSGRVTGSGAFPLGASGAQAYTIQVGLRDFVVRQSGDYAARFDGDFDVTLVQAADGTLRPNTRGTVRLDRAEIIRELNQTSPPPSPEQIYDYDIRIDAPRGIFIVNSQIDMELAGDVTVRQTPERFEMIGELQILRGYYTLLLRRFRVTEGTLNFNRVDAIDPDIDITAETNDAEYVITVRITGQASNPRLQFSARKPNEEDAAPLTEQQILNRLAPGSAIATGIISSQEGGTSQAGLDVLTNSVQLLFGQVQRDLARTLGVDEVRYDTPEAAVPGTERSYGQLTVSKWLTPEVTVSYSQELGAPEQGLSVEYRLGRLLFLRGEVVRRRATELREEYNLDLRFWYDY